MQNADLTEKSGTLTILTIISNIIETLFNINKIEIVKKKFYRHKSPVPLKKVDIEKVLASNKIFFLVKKSINTLLVTCIMIIKLDDYI